MREEELRRIIKDEKLLLNKLETYERLGLIPKIIFNFDEIQGHLEKAQHNLQFVMDIKKLKYPDWRVTGCYYAVYHAALSLLLVRGYASKNHDATVCLLIKEYHRQGISEEEIELINRFFLDYEDLLFYVQSKNRREEATYSSKLRFDDALVEELRIKAVLFVEKARNIIRENTA